MNKKLFALALSLFAFAQEVTAGVVVSADTTSCCPAPRPTCCEVRTCRTRRCCPRPYRRRVCCPRPCVRVCRPKRVYCPRIRCCRPKPVCCAPVVPPCPAAPCVNGTVDAPCSRPMCSSSTCTTGECPYVQPSYTGTPEQEEAPAYTAPMERPTAPEERMTDDMEENVSDDEALYDAEESTEEASA